MVTIHTLVRPQRHWQPLLERLLDGTVLLVSLLLVGTLNGVPLEVVWGGAAWPVFLSWAILLITAETTGLYRNWDGARRYRRWSTALGTWALVFVAWAVLRLFFDPILLEVPRGWVIEWWMVTAGGLVLHRLLSHQILGTLRRHNCCTKRAAIAGVNELGVQLAETFGATPDLGARVVGFYDDRPADRTCDIPPGLPPRAGTIDDLVEAARRSDVELIYITIPMRAESRIQRDLLDRLADTTASVYIVPDFFVFELLHARWTDVAGLPAVSVFETPIYGVNGLLKRLVDLLGATVALTIFGLPMMAIAAAIKWSSPGPVFFRQRRYGLDGRSVRVWKFRTMTVCEDGDHVKQAQRDDDRVTRVGAFLRKTSLDELPQLFNVLAGNMSLVGPRPHALAHNEQYRKLILGYMLRHKVKPGITGLAQVSGFRGETDTLEKMEKRIEYDHRYIREWSVWLDIKILFKTLWVVWRQQETAY